MFTLLGHFVNILEWLSETFFILYYLYLLSAIWLIILNWSWNQTKCASLLKKRALLNLDSWADG